MARVTVGYSLFVTVYICIRSDGVIICRVGGIILYVIDHFRIQLITSDAHYSGTCEVVCLTVESIHELVNIEEICRCLR